MADHYPTDIGHVSFSGLSEPCSIGSVVEVVINAHGESSSGSVLVEASAPSGRLHKCHVQQTGNAYTATFTPNEVGDWHIGILYDNEHIRGSPFSCFVYDANLVRVYGLDVGLVGQELKFNVDALNAGHGVLKVSVYHHGRPIPSHVDEQQLGGIYCVQFTPDGAGQYKIHVLLNKSEVKGSPFILDIADASSVSVYGDNLRMASVDKLSSFMIHAVGADSKDITVSITAPSGKKKRARVIPLGDSAYRVEWKPVEAGEHYIDVRLYNQSVHDSPYACNVGDPELVTVRNMPTVIRTSDFGRDETFEIDASAAGSGNLEIMINGGRVGCKVRELGGRQYVASFTPTQPITHIVEMRFNGEPVKHSPWRIEVASPSTAPQQPPSAYMLAQLSAISPQPPINTLSTLYTSTGQHRRSDIKQEEDYTSGGASAYVEISGVGLQRACVGRITSFDISGVGVRSDDISIRLTSPSGNEIASRIVPIMAKSSLSGDNAELRCEYNVGEVGDYRLDMSIGGQRVEGSPFYISAYAPHKVYIEPIPGGAVNKPVQFYVDANEAGKGQLEISVNQGRVPNNVQMHGSGRCLVTFIPQQTGSYLIDVTFNNEQVPGSPVRVEIGTTSATTPTSTTTPLTSFVQQTTRFTGGGDTSSSPIRYSNTPPPHSPPPLSPTLVRHAAAAQQKRTIDASATSTAPKSFAMVHRQYGVGSTDTTTPTSDDRLPSVTTTRPWTSPSQTRHQPTIHGASSPTTQLVASSPIATRTVHSKPIIAYSGETTKHERIIDDKTEYHRSASGADETGRTNSVRQWYDSRQKNDPIGATTVASYGVDTRGPIQADAQRSMVSSSSSSQKHEEVKRLSRENSSGTANVDVPIITTTYERRRNYENVDDNTIDDNQLPPMSTFDPSKMMSSERISIDKESTPVIEKKITAGVVDSTEKKTTADDASFYSTRSPVVDQSDSSFYSTRSKVDDHSTIVPDKTIVEQEQIPSKVVHRISNEVPVRTAITKDDDGRQSEKINILPDSSSSSHIERTTLKQQDDVEKLQKQRHGNGSAVTAVEAELSPRTRRRLLEQSLRKEDDLHESTSVLPPSTPPQLAPTSDVIDSVAVAASSTESKSGTIIPPKSPKLSLKSKSSKPFEWGKSKFSTKHEVFKRGKEVEVKLESLKVPKDETFRVVVLAPAKVATAEKTEMLPKVKKVRSGYEITFKPTDVGTHKIMAYVGDALHPMSPFNIRVFDASEIEIGSIPKRSILGDSVEFTVDAGRAGFGNLEIAIKDTDGVIIPSHVTQVEEGTAKFLVTFSPTRPGIHTVHTSFNKENLKNSPFEVDAVSAASTVVEKETKKEKQRVSLTKSVQHQQQTVKVDNFPSMSRANETASFRVLAVSEAPQVNILDTNGEQIAADITQQGDDVFKVDFTPVIVGDHRIEVKYSALDVREFVCRVYNPGKIKVGTIPNGVVDKPVHFVVDASEAGVGNLEVAVNDGRVPSMAQALGQHRYDISFIPRDTEDYTISIRFNNEPVNGSPFTCRMINSVHATASGVGIERVAVRRPAIFHVTLEDGGEQITSDELPIVNITDVHGESVRSRVTRHDTDSNVFVVEYTPTTIGNHSIDVSYAGNAIGGSPFTAKAYDAKCVKLYPLQGGQLGQSATFIIDAAKAGAGNMEIIVSVDNHNVPNFVQAEGQARFRVSFVPQEATEHWVSVKFNGESIPGSPMRCAIGSADTIIDTVSHVSSASPAIATTNTAISGSLPEIQLIGDLSSAQVNQIKGFTIDVEGRAGDCNVVVTDANGGPVPVKCFRQQDDSFWVEFTPQDVGNHTIEVTFADVPITGSPFRCEVVDPKRIKVQAPSIPLVMRQEAVILVNRDGAAGKGELEVELTDPNGQMVHVDATKMPNGDKRLTFVPTITGHYKLNTKIAGFHVPGSPQMLLVEDGSRPHAYGPALEHAVNVDSAATILFDPKKSKGGLKVHIRNHKNNKVRHTTNKRSDGITEIIFNPNEVGIHQAEIYWGDKPISGSPFEIAVIDARKIRISEKNCISNGQMILAVGQRRDIDIDATAAGPGVLRADVHGPDNRPLRGGVDTQSLGYGKHRVSFVPIAPGEHSLFLYWSDQPVPTANPLIGTTTQFDGHTTQFETASTSKQAATAKSQQQQHKHDDDELADHLRVVLRGEGLTRASTKQLADFVVDGSDARRDGRPACTLMGQKADIPCQLTHLGNNVYRVTYTALIAGKYELEVLWEGKQVRGSPFHVDVTTAGEAEHITVDAQSLRLGIVNEEVKTIIDTRRAGPGQLSAQCMGPTKLAYCELYDHRDGTYTLCIRPSEVGKHTLVIKYAEEHVPGSPFTVNVSHPPDPSRVRVYGPGIEHGILSTFKSNFVVETKGAGAGQLTVRVRGPKGAFNVEMQREKKQDRTIHCKYEPREPGDYQVEVKWHGEHVPGSPFFVMIVDTEQELDRFLSGEAPSPQPPTPFVPPGWLGPPPPPLMMPPPVGIVPHHHHHRGVGPLPPPLAIQSGGPGGGGYATTGGPFNTSSSAHRGGMNSRQNRYATNGY